MKKNFLILFAVILCIACDKEINEPALNEAKEFPVLNIPTDLPKNIEDILISTPCWKISGLEYHAQVSDGNVVIYHKDTEYPIGGDANRTYKFNKNNELIYYCTYVYPNVENTTRYKKLTWNLDWILKYSNEEILYAASDPTIDGELSILILTPGTQDHLDKLLSKLPDDN